MKYVDETVIDRIVDGFSQSEVVIEGNLRALEQEQPELLDYLFSDEATVFTQPERDLLLYLVLVICAASQEVNGPLPLIDQEQLSAAEEHNWELLEGISSHRFRERLDVFFDNTSQEDLLAFVEDSLLDDEESEVTKEGREPLFVLAKSLIDALDEAIGEQQEG